MISSTEKEKVNKTSKNQKQTCGIMTSNTSDDNKDRDTTNNEKNLKHTGNDKQRENRTVTMKEYQARRETDTSCDMKVSSIMKEMTKTYASMQMRPITPLVDGLH